MPDKMKLAAAGNLLVPAYLALLQKGYSIHVKNRNTEDEFWIAENESCEFVAEDPLQLLGVVTLGETRGENWHASDEEIESFLEQYGL